MITQYVNYLRLGVCYTFLGVAYVPYMLAIIIAGIGYRDHLYEIKDWHKNYWDNVL